MRLVIRFWFGEPNENADKRNVEPRGEYNSLWIVITIPHLSFQWTIVYIKSGIHYSFDQEYTTEYANSIPIGIILLINGS